MLSHVFDYFYFRTIFVTSGFCLFNLFTMSLDINKARKSITSIIFIRKVRITFIRFGIFDVGDWSHATYELKFHSKPWSCILKANNYSVSILPSMFKIFWINVLRKCCCFLTTEQYTVGLAIEILFNKTFQWRSRGQSSWNTTPAWSRLWPSRRRRCTPRPQTRWPPSTRKSSATGGNTLFLKRNSIKLT